VTALAEHFDAVGDDGLDEWGDWRPFPPEYVLEGELLDVHPAYGPNRWRLTDWRPGKGRGVDLEVHTTGPRCRLRMPIRLEPLPWNGDVIAKLGIGDDGRDRVEKHWFEQVGDETHYLIEVA